VPPDFRAISSGQLSLGIAELSNYNFILEFQIDKILVLLHRLEPDWTSSTGGLARQPIAGQNAEQL